MSDLRLGRNWDRQFEQDLPDCRLRFTDREEDIVIIGGRMPMERVYCADCHVACGAVTPNWTAHVFFICDECVRKNGRPIGKIEIPNSVVQR